MSGLEYGLEVSNPNQRTSEMKQRINQAGQAGVDFLMGTAGVGLIIILLCGLIFGACSWIPSYNRHQLKLNNSVKRDQALKNERNLTTINDIKIAQTEQLVKVERQKAAIRLADAIGIRKAQDEISKTLTPLYIQHEAIQSQEKTAASGRNNTIIYVPSGQSGVPIVQEPPLKPQSELGK